jgi:hypothetical protein
MAGKKHQVFFPATTEQNIARVNLVHKPSVSFYLMAIIAIVAIDQECIIPVFLLNWSVVTYQGSRVPKGPQDFQHTNKL